ncbi:related to pisatin demethylase cytochrome P450 [Cephalotrichum gorgonifer]|uniref:Related to pisatin demethylase cytochrome P450 n=1 Tax=Cephalotrichum gorgonifer TaxID=2041049 RepID=A0AAE8N8M0_9PEZI|nr:related to pisatin demethylase cytochrome P450 [Cephalotrichum gorgonifer]
MASPADLSIQGSPKSLVAQALSLLATHWPYLIPLAPVLVIVRLITNRYASPLRKYPGPPLASATRLWKVLSTASTQTHLEHIALHKRYGPIVRIAPNEVSLASPEAARALLSAGKRFYKTNFYAVFPPPENPDIFTEVREDVHAQKKKVANVPYSMAAMQQLSPFINDTIELLMTKLDGFAHGEGKVDLGDWLHYFAFDVLGEIAFSKKFGFLDEGRDVERAIAVIDEMQRYNGIVGQVPWMDYVLRRNPLRKILPGMGTGNALITRLALGEMARRRPFDKESAGKWRSGDGRQDLLASLIQGHLKDPEKFSEGDVFAVAHGAIFAGSDSTASTMQSFFWHVLADPAVRKALFAEIRGAAETGAIPATGNLSWAESQSLPFFQACLKEAMRVRPAVGLNITRVIPPGGAELDGEFFEGGTEVAVNGWVLHRDKATFGEDCEVFRPGRWLEGGEENAKRMERYMFQFGGGAHVCIGRNLALLEINKVIPRIIRDFDIELIDPSKPLEAHATFFVVQSGLKVYIRPRAA